MKGYGTPPAEWDDQYHAEPNRYPREHRRCGRSGVFLPPLTLGCWQNFGALDPFEGARQMLRAAFDHGIFHWDYANNYGRPPGSAEEYFGTIFDKDFRRHRGELFLSTKAGYDMWPGPMGTGGSRKYLLTSLDQSLRRMRLDYVDLFYSHRYDPNTPLEETASALTDAVRQGKALYVGISSYPLEPAARMLEMLAASGTPCLAYQGSYSLLNRWPEKGMLELLREHGVGFLAFSPLNQGLLSDDYAQGRYAGHRIEKPATSLPVRNLPTEVTEALRRLADVARTHGRSLSQLALQWVLRRSEVTSAVMGIRNLDQLRSNLAAVDLPPLDEDQIGEIDALTFEAGLDLWTPSDS